MSRKYTLDEYIETLKLCKEELPGSTLMDHHIRLNMIKQILKDLATGAVTHELIVHDGKPRCSCDSIAEKYLEIDGEMFHLCSSCYQEETKNVGGEK